MPLFIPSVKTNFSDEIDVSVDASRNDGSFMFQIINLNDWI